MVAPSGKAWYAASVPSRAMNSTASTTYMMTIDKAVATIESRRNRRDSGSLSSSVERLRAPPVTRPTAPARMYPAVPKCPMAMLSSPVIRRVQGWAKAGNDTMRMPSRAPPRPTTIADP